MNKMNEKYKLSKSAKVGDKCICPSCGSSFIKENYQQAFCKTKGGTICKDKYWNTITPEKRCNTTRISPANTCYIETRMSYFDDGLDYLLECGDRD
jgi:hypothetical protein